MRSRSVLRGTLAVGVPLLAWVALRVLLAQSLLPVRVWYFHRYVQPYDDPPGLPLGWVPQIVVPLLGSFIAGALAAIIFQRKSLVLSAAVGAVALCDFLAWWYKAFPWDWEIVAYGLLNGTVAFLACDLTQRFLAKRAHAVDARH